MVPKARSYYGSVLVYTATEFAQFSINGKFLRGQGVPNPNFNPNQTPNPNQIAVEPYLRPGLNVLTGTLVPYRSCNYFGDSITLRMTGLQRPNALVLSWHKVPGAARYYLQVWLVKAAPGQTITPDSEVNIAMQTTGARATLDDAAMPDGTYQWRTAAVNAHGELISRWTPAQTVTLN